MGTWIGTIAYFDLAADGEHYVAMPRTASIVVPGVPHHVAQRGNNRQETFFDAPLKIPGNTQPFNKLAQLVKQ